MLRGYFNVAAFQAPGNANFGNTARNLGWGPGMTEFDISLHKKWNFTERLGLLVRIDCFNLINHANFATPQDRWARAISERSPARFSARPGACSSSAPGWNSERPRMDTRATGTCAGRGRSGGERC